MNEKQPAGECPLKLKLSARNGNLLFFVSTASFFCVSLAAQKSAFLGAFIALCLFAVVCMKNGNIFSKIRKAGLRLKIFSFATALGICTALRNHFPATFGKSGLLLRLLGSEGARSFFLESLGIVGAIVAIPAVFFFVCVFWNFLLSFIRQTGLFDGVKKREFIFYAIAALVLSVFSWTAFFASDAFYAVDYDIIYTSDHPGLVTDNVYFWLYNYENDLRQPLFALFAAPLLGAFYPFVGIIPCCTVVCACLLGSAQIVLLLFSFFIVARMIGFSSILRALFVLFCCSSYTALLSCVMVEQYIIAFFYLVLFLFAFCKKRKSEPLLFACGGTLLTSFCFFPLVFTEIDFSSVKNFFRKCFDLAVKFIFVLLIAGRFDVIWCLKSKVSKLITFTGISTPLAECLAQYSIFIKNLFLTPASEIHCNSSGSIVWRLRPAENLNSAGIIIFFLCVLSVVLNWKKAAAKICGAWILFSFLLLAVVGWGCAENGQILYSLYFFWAFAALLFMLARFLTGKIRFERIPHYKKIAFIVVCVVSLVFMLLNVPCILRMIEFAKEYYPLRLWS